MTRYEHYKSGQVFGIKYIFDSMGDRIPDHRHDHTHAHNVVCLKGKVNLIVNEMPRLLYPGDIADFDWSQPHRIIAMEHNSAVLHLFLNGQPEGYDRLPESELRGTL